MLIVAALTVTLTASAEAHKHHHRFKHHRECTTNRCAIHADRLWAKHHRPKFTGYVVEGRTSVFGYLTGDSEGQTADGGTTARPCIAIRDDSTLGRWFMVTVAGHKAKLLHCDWGPASFTGRSIDITGEGAQALGFSPTGYPTGAWGRAAELR